MKYDYRVLWSDGKVLSNYSHDRYPTNALTYAIMDWKDTQHVGTTIERRPITDWESFEPNYEEF